MSKHLPVGRLLGKSLAMRVETARWYCSPETVQRAEPNKVEKKELAARITYSSGPHVRPMIPRALQHAVFARVQTVFISCYDSDASVRFHLGLLIGRVPRELALCSQTPVALPAQQLFAIGSV